MKIKIYHHQNQEISSLKSNLESKFSSKGITLEWKFQIVGTETTLTLAEIFNRGEIDFAFLPATLLEYPFPRSFQLVAIWDLDTNIENDRFDFSRFAIVARNVEASILEEFKHDDLRSKYGKVFITGFGPGDPDLLTIKAVKAIENADVIFYDSLINQDFLNQYDVEKVFVGKRKGNHAYGQNDIDEMLYQSAISGKNTVRLKGGDPFIFGRGGEEFDYLRKRFVEAEVIPGITSAFGAATSLGISLTQRLVSSSVAFCTGFPKEDRRIPDADTLVFYMSASNLQETAQILIKSGRKKETPVALIRNATLLDQESQFSTLIELANGKAGLESPMVAIIGDVAIDKNII